MNEILNDFIIGNGTDVSTIGKETLEQQTNAHQRTGFERFVDIASQNQVPENNIDDKIGRAVDNAILTVENLMHDAIWTAMDKVVIQRVEMVVKSITSSSGHGTNSEVQNPDRRGFLGNAGNTPLMSASSRLDLYTNQDKNDETRNEKKFEHCDFPALRPKYGRRTHAHHNSGVLIGLFAASCYFSK